LSEHIDPATEPIIVDNPGGLGFRITQLWAYLAVQGEDDDDEGVAAIRINNQWMPLVAADEKRLKDLTPWALRLANESGIPIKLARFDVRTDIRVIEPTAVKK
jgi:hypothetical protein